MTSSALEIDPESVEALARAMSLIVQRADEVATDVSIATTRSDLTGGAAANLAEIAEELGLLSTILIERSLLASGFRVNLDPESRANELALWASLADDQGVEAPIAGDHALTVILEYAGGGDRDGDGITTPDELQAVADDPSTSEVVRLAIETLLDDDDLLAGIATDNFWTGYSLTPEAIEQWLEDNQALRDEIAASETIDQETQLEAVNRQIYVHDPIEAREFLPKIDNAATHGTGLPMDDVSVTGVEALLATALTGVDPDDLRTRYTVVSQLPETNDATRGTQITLIYAEAGIAIDAIVNGSAAGDLSAVGHAGLNWPIWGASASDTVAGLIDGSFDLQVIELSAWFPGAEDMRQLAADANQAIFTDVLDDYITFIEYFDTPDATNPARIEAFLSTFKPGEEDLRTGFAFQIAAMLSTDPAVRDQHQLQANWFISAHEQAVAHEHLQLDPVVDPIADTLSDMLTGNDFLGPVGAPVGTEIAERIFSEVGTYDIRLDPEHHSGETEWSIPLNEPIPPSTHDGNLARVLDATDENNPDAVTIHDAGLDAFDVDVSNLPDIPGTTEEYGVSIDVDDWADNEEGLQGSWQEFDNRMPVIFDLMQEHHSNQDVFDAAELIIEAG